MKCECTSTVDAQVAELEVLLGSPEAVAGMESLLRYATEDEAKNLTVGVLRKLIARSELFDADSVHER